MLIDLTLLVEPKAARAVKEADSGAPYGHLGTHYDVMDKEFPIQNAVLPGVVFDVRGIEGRDVEIEDVDLSRIEKGMFVAFCAGWTTRHEYATKDYFTGDPQLSDALIDAVLDRDAAIIGVDFQGVRRGREHTPKDQYCADRGVFIVENLCHLEQVLDAGGAATFYTFPMNFANMTGLPCRVMAEV